MTAIHKRVSRFVKKWRTEWAVFTTVTWTVAIPLTIVIFPSNSLWLALLVTFGGWLDSLNSLADRLGDSEEDKESTRDI